MTARGRPRPRRSPPMGCNFGDIDNDGYPRLLPRHRRHVVLGTSSRTCMFKNVGGKTFEDVTMSSGTGHLQKGHGVSFADYDDDGDLDLFVEAGGARPGRQRRTTSCSATPATAATGSRSSWSAPGPTARPSGRRIQATVDRRADGPRRSIYRTVGNNSSFGGNSLVEPIGLARRRRRSRAGDHLADEPDDPDVPRHRRRPDDRDHRGDRGFQGDWPEADPVGRVEHARPGSERSSHATSCPWLWPWSSDSATTRRRESSR